MSIHTAYIFIRQHNGIFIEGIDGQILECIERYFSINNPKRLNLNGVTVCNYTDMGGNEEKNIKDPSRVTVKCEFRTIKNMAEIVSLSQKNFLYLLHVVPLMSNAII